MSKGSRNSNDTEDEVTETEQEDAAPIKEEPVVKKAGSKAPAKYPVSELLKLIGQLMPEVDRPFAVGAMRHAGLKNTDEVTTDEFREKVEAFRNVRAF